MKSILQVLFLAILSFGAFKIFEAENHSSAPISSQKGEYSNQLILQAFANQRSDIQVQGIGLVNRVLPDDLKGSKHQRFILTLPNTDHTLLIAHNIDLADRVSSLEVGDTVAFYGEYEWNAKGGVVHWTHRDPNYRHEDGWLKHAGKMYQ
ncbi:DUF3465 domain-containing protein [Pseudomaricurvus sp.]|uniref:DUF3465 domain-containing protein n=1 Tax=Pseudomaricurvus sp. TaxID=2004510 RepID=UPI003F6D64C7